MRVNTLPYTGSRMCQWVAGSQSRLKVGKCAVVPEDPKATGAHARNQHRRVTGRLRLGNGNPTPPTKKSDGVSNMEARSTKC
jgi:hypothetical protein